MSSYTPWQKQQRRKVRQEHEKKLERAMSHDGDSGIYPVIRVEWRKSSYMVVFNYRGYERCANIIDQARERFGRLTADTRDRIESTVPSELVIDTHVSQYYIPGIPGNVKQPRTTYRVSSFDLEKWFDDAADAES